MQRLLTCALILAPVLALPGRAAAQGGYGTYQGQFGYPGAGAGYYGANFAGPGYMGPTATGAGYIGSGGPFQATPRPIMSPFLGLRLGQNAAANYFLGTVPNLQAQAQSTRFIVPEVGAIRQPSADTDDLLRQLNPTGHPVQFLSYGPYYSSLNRGPQSTMLTPYSMTRPPQRR
jgi:hypothetical protein